MTHAPLPPPPPSPAPPPPKLPCTAGSCVVLSGAATEILRLNQPWSPSPPSEFASDLGNYLTYGGPANGGLLDVRKPYLV